MQIHQPYHLRMCTTFYNVASYLTAGIHYVMLHTGLLKAPCYLANTPGSAYKILRHIWCARIFRRMLSVLVRSPLRRDTLRLIHFTVPLPTSSGCVIVICHTPWKRLLVQWCLENDFGLVVASGNWPHQRKLIQRRAKGFREMREIVNHLQQNGRIIIAADIFDNLNNCPVKFLGNSFNASVLPARLARLTNVPLIVAIPVLYNGSIHFIPGPQVEFNLLAGDTNSIIQNVISFLEKEIIKDPAIWPSYVK